MNAPKYGTFWRNKALYIIPPPPYYCDAFLITSTLKLMKQRFLKYKNNIKKNLIS